jgi:deoxyadenosine/deoxycytidine kinase
MSEGPKPPLRVAVVGVCASGKSTLIEALRRAGYDARHVAQEHSYVPGMWQRCSRPDVLIYLDVAYAAIRRRRPGLQIKPEDIDEQLRRLSNARAHCDLYLDTTHLNPAQVQERVIAFLRNL